MKNQTDIKRYVLIIITILFVAKTNAQIIYTDVNPDSIVVCNVPGPGMSINNAFNLDLNNDGIDDFIIKLHTKEHKCVPIPGGIFTNIGYVSISYLDSNAFESSISGYPLIELIGDTIDSRIMWVSLDQYLKSSWRNFHYLSMSCSGGIANIGGNWGSGFIGLRIKVGGANYFGWARLSVLVNDDYAEVTIFDYAYNSQHNQFILAGDSGTGITRVNEIKAKLKYNLSPNPTTDYFTIDLPDRSPVTEVAITNAFGQEVSRARYSNTSKLELEIKSESGLYFVKVVAGEKSGVYKVVKM